MPRTLDGARLWRLEFVRPRRHITGSREITTSSGASQDREKSSDPPPEASEPRRIVEFADEAGSDGTEVLTRLRRLERQTAVLTQRLLAEGRVSESIALGHRHSAQIKELLFVELKTLEVQEKQGRLVPIEAVDLMIVSAISEPCLLLRNLVQLARDDGQRQALEAFSRSCLQALEQGAAKGFKEGWQKYCRTGASGR